MDQVAHDLYDRCEQFNAWEAACLIAGFDPASIDREDRRGMPGKIKVLLSLIEDAFQNALFYCQLAFNDGIQVYDHHGEPVAVSFAVSGDPSVLPSVELWAVYEDAVAEDGRGPDMFALERLNTRTPQFRREDIKKWLALIGWKDAHSFMARGQAQEKALASRERETLLKLVISMAVGGYGHDVAAKKTDTVSRIMEDVERRGLSISDETVRKYLKEAAELLPGEPHKD